MTTPNTLRWRVTLAILVIVSVSSIANALGVYVYNYRLEVALLDTRVKQEMDALVERIGRNEAIALMRLTDMRIYLRSGAAKLPIPDDFSATEPGFYHDVELDGRFYHLSVRDIGDDRAYVALDVTAVEHKEDILALFILLGALITPLVAIGVGFWLSRKVVAPVSSLADQVANMDPKHRHVRLAPAFHGYEVEVIARAFDRYMERVDNLLEREQSFTAVASHELRSPLTVISTAAELLEGDSRLPGSLRRTVTRIQHAVRDMSEFTTALLFLAREPEASKASIEAETAMHEFLPRIIDHYRSLVLDSAVDLKLAANDQLVVAAPESHLTIIVGNLLRNAISYTETGQITASLRERCLTIVDTGCGIPPEDLTHIFERHYRGPNSLGCGLGLYTAKNICDRYGWRLHITSRPDAGTTAAVQF